MYKRSISGFICWLLGFPVASVSFVRYTAKCLFGVPFVDTYAQTEDVGPVTAVTLWQFGFVRLLGGTLGTLPLIPLGTAPGGVATTYLCQALNAGVVTITNEEGFLMSGTIPSATPRTVVASASGWFEPFDNDPTQTGRTIACSLVNSVFGDCVVISGASTATGNSGLPTPAVFQVSLTAPPAVTPTSSIALTVPPTSVVLPGPPTVSENRQGTADLMAPTQTGLLLDMHTAVAGMASWDEARLLLNARCRPSSRRCWPGVCARMSWGGSGAAAPATPALAEAAELGRGAAARGRAPPSSRCCWPGERRGAVRVSEHGHGELGRGTAARGRAPPSRCCWPGACARTSWGGVPLLMLVSRDTRAALALILARPLAPGAGDGPAAGAASPRGAVMLAQMSHALYMVPAARDLRERGWWWW
ncbi:hypothetical protein GGX14DRAFT_695713 [Mycena pura]|uniref:Uncharacterized protein n=1 Tax=Mycena pura TaxID=153505 RepID=A0AAD6VS23_9AGAR|nr:hypothetical protein GGX14DRAFT_695713 [Mycena pura]